MNTQQLTADGFRESVFDYTTSEEWGYKGTLPAIVDFYADWCAPCKAVAPILEELAQEYTGRLTIYKIDIEKEQELSSLFGIQSIPTFLFLPMHGEPMVQRGGLSKDVFVEIIETRLLMPVAESNA